MSSTEQAPEPTMDEILASIRRIIADDEATAGSRPAAKPAAPAPRQPERPRPQQTTTPASLVDDIAHALRGGDEEPPAREAEDDILDLTEVFEADRSQPEPAPMAMPEPEEPPLRPQPPVWESPIPPAPARAEPPEPRVRPEPPREFPRERPRQQPVAEAATTMVASTQTERSFMGYQEETFSEREETSFEDDIEEVEAPSEPAAFHHDAPAVSWEKETRNGAAPKSLEDCVREMLRPLLRDWLENNLPKILESAVREELAAQVRDKRRQH